MANEESGVVRLAGNLTRGIRAGDWIWERVATEGDGSHGKGGLGSGEASERI